MPRRAPLPVSLASPASLRLWSVLALACAGLGCAGEEWSRRHERDVDRILEEGVVKSEVERRSAVIYPEPLPEEPPAAELPPPTLPADELRILQLADALAIAVAYSREYITREEALVLDAIELSNVRHAFSPQLAATLGVLFADGDGLSRSNQASLGASLTQALATGGDLSVDASTSAIHTGGGDLVESESGSAALAIRMTQPLLRGSGSEIALEPLVQGERNLVYRIREFELFREDFSIDVASRYFGLVSQKQAIENQRRNLEGFVFGRRQAEALFRVGRTNELDVLRARRSELGSQDDLIEAEEAYHLDLDRFRIFLGLPATTRVDVDPAPPAFVQSEYDLQSAIEVAMHNRLDLWNRKEGLEDAERAVRIARDRLRPDLDLSLAYVLADASDASLEPDLPRDERYSAGLVLSLPLDRLGERNAVRATTISLLQARRSYEEFVDGLVVEIQSAFRELVRREKSLEIQRQLIEDQERNVRIAQLQFERGEVGNRDVVEAQEALLEAQNSLIDEQVGYEIARLQLLRNLGILFIDEKGMWVE